MPYIDNNIIKENKYHVKLNLKVNIWYYIIYILSDILYGNAILKVLKGILGLRAHEIELTMNKIDFSFPHNRWKSHFMI